MNSFRNSSGCFIAAPLCADAAASASKLACRCRGPDSGQRYLLHHAIKAAGSSAAKDGNHYVEKMKRAGKPCRISSNHVGAYRLAVALLIRADRVLRSGPVRLGGLRRVIAIPI
jgi:hypothetical protein